MVPKHYYLFQCNQMSFRAVLFRMVPKPLAYDLLRAIGFRAVLFRMVPKLVDTDSNSE